MAIIRASCPPSVCGSLRGRGVRGGICVVCGAGAMPATRPHMSVRAERLSAAGRLGALARRLGPVRAAAVAAKLLRRSVV